MPSRRAAQRVVVRWPIRIRQGGCLIEGRVQNASATGILFTSELRFRVGESVAVDVVVSPLAFFRCSLLIVRDQGRSWLDYSYGARFLHLDPVDREILIKALETTGPLQQTAPINFAGPFG